MYVVAKSFSSGEYVVTSGGNMNCKYIIHVKGQRSTEGWERMVTKALTHADNKGCRSLSFPALGTGVVDIDPTDISLCMFRAISNYNPVNLQTVRIIVFQSEMLPVFEFIQQSYSYVPLEQTKDDYTGKTRVDMGLDDKDETIIKYPLHTDENLIHGHIVNRDQGCGEKETDEWFIVPDHSIAKESSNDLGREEEYECTDIDISNYMLRDIEIDEIKRIARDTKIIVKEGKIELEGLTANVNIAVVSIYKYLLEVKDKESAQTVQKYVEWHYESSLLYKWTQFKYDINLQIENAYQASKDSCIFKDNSGTEYVIDFKKMEEHEKNNPWKKYKIKRVDKGFPIGLPKSWVSMGNNQTVVEITLNYLDDEYEEVMSKFKATSTKTVSISEIRRVQNPYLYQQYVAKRKEIEVKNGKDPQQWLWHGTYPDTVDKVINNGFNRRYCGKNGTRFGAGVYFAVNASYSAGYCRPDFNGLKHMFCVQVATGDVCKGKSSMNVLPPKPGARSHVTYDSASDNPFNPEMYVIFHDSQAYPAYHIIFK
ncbi:protein mono-ADP-ribosyltransferase PARP15-like [Saccostrea cucullata]|uniref:protein mono-ADP-ribosyltransferase PARP15-like n=1 Tax=Saccostrea cuccullata TaxID=36930 RepID=UPI002ECFD74E